ncbi:universal stress protein [Flavobacteriaceae bacterium F08102]|nr:universal stress protein [Flavobacteriaceae bacterium F08102]
MKNVLLPTDFSENSWNAIVYALNLFKETTCTFYLLHVNTMSYARVNNATYTNPINLIENEFTLPSKEKLRSVLKRISKAFPTNKKHHFFILPDHNFFIDSIRNHVLERQIDIIVMGTKGASGLKKVIVGSNAADVIKKVKCTTLVVPENAKFTGLDEVAFPTDYYLSFGVGLLKPIYELLQIHHSNLHVIHITNKPEELTMSQVDNRDLLQDYFSSFETTFHHLVNKKVENAIDCFVQSRGVKMVVMVAKNLNYFQQILFHSKIEDITYHIRIPFLVIHDT